MITPQNATDVKVWQDLNPELSITDGLTATLRDDWADGGKAEFDVTSLSDRFWAEGYFLIEDMLPVNELIKLRSGIENLIGRGLSPALIYLYDEAWDIFRRLRPLLSHFLGDRIGLLPHFWAWHVDPADDGRGWPPHRDYQGDSVIGDDMLISLSLWVPLSNATPENGCMHVLPRNFEKQYPAPVANPQDVRLQDVRALPAAPGAVMGWRQDLYHWGGRSSPYCRVPRVSLSLEFQNAAFDPLAEQLLCLERPPEFLHRLKLIAAQFAKYRHMQSMDDQTLRWAEDVLHACDRLKDMQGS